MGGPLKYPAELRERAVRLARGADRPISAVARDLGIHPETLRTWVRQDEADDGSRIATGWRRWSVRSCGSCVERCEISGAPTRF